MLERGELTGAASAADEAVHLFRSEPLWYWRFRILKARILVSRSEYKEALAILQEDPPSAFVLNDVGVRRSMVLGIAYRIAQDFGKSAEKLREAEDRATRAQPRILCEVLNAKAALEGSEKKFIEAEGDYRQALLLARRHGKAYQEAAALVGLAWIATGREHFGEAADLSQAALQISRSRGMQGLVGTVLGNLGWSYFDLGDFESALDYFRQGAEVSSLAGLSGYSAYWFIAEANVLVAQHDYSAAEQLSRDTLKRARALNHAETIALCLNTLAEISLRSGRLDEAEKYNEEALELETSGQDHFGALESALLSGRIETRKRHFEQAKRLFEHVSGDPSAPTVSRWEAQAGLATLYETEDLPLDAEREYQKAIETIQSAQSAIDRTDLRLSFLAGGIEFYQGYADFLIAQRRPVDALRAADLSRARTLEEGLESKAKTAKISVSNLRPQQLAERLNSTLLFYWLGEQHSYLWVITPSQTTYFVLAPELQIDLLVKSYEEALLGTRDPLENANADAQRLYSILIEPAKNLIPPHSRVVLLPDGSLYGLNFETLVVPGAKPHYWIEDVTLSTGSSLTLLASAAARPAPKGKSLFLVGDTISPNDHFPRLAQAPEEMKAVEKYFSKSQTEILSRGDATPSAYLVAEPERYTYLHFVTHGTASRARPLESAVILSQEKNGDAYKLYARDIVKQRLAANIVTISACNTSGARTFSGEGLVGLSWAFLRAGAHNVIGALWEVSDTATPQLMDKFYEGLSRAEDPASALRAAKLSLLHSDSIFRKPRYWAPFQLYSGS